VDDSAGQGRPAPAQAACHGKQLSASWRHEADKHLVARRWHRWVHTDSRGDTGGPPARPRFSAKHHTPVGPARPSGAPSGWDRRPAGEAHNDEALTWPRVHRAGLPLCRTAALPAGWRCAGPVDAQRSVRAAAPWRSFVACTGLVPTPWLLGHRYRAGASAFSPLGTPFPVWLWGAPAVSLGGGCTDEAGRLRGGGGVHRAEPRGACSPTGEGVHRRRTAALRYVNVVRCYLRALVSAGSRLGDLLAVAAAAARRTSRLRRRHRTRYVDARVAARVVP